MDDWDEYDLDSARTAILDCDDPSVAASIYFRANCEVGPAGDIWIADRNCWADARSKLNFAIWLRER